MRCVYVSASSGIHDERWLSALRSLGFAPATVVVEPGSGWTDEAVEALERIAGGAPILAGPLTTVTRGLVLAGVTGVCGLSWGFDLPELQERADLAWLPRLGALIADSPATIAIARAARMPADRIVELPWGIDLESFPLAGPRTAPGSLGLPACSRYVVTLRAHEALYCVDDVLRGFALIDDPRLGLVVGNDGSSTAMLRDLAGELGIADRVAFIGRIPERELAPLLRGAAAYVSASPVDGTSVTLLQAMACGTPAVVTRIPGNACWVDGAATGALFTPGDPQSLAHALGEAIDRAWDPMPARLEVESRADWTRNLPRLAKALAIAVA